MSVTDRCHTYATGYSISIILRQVFNSRLKSVHVAKSGGVLIEQVSNNTMGILGRMSGDSSMISLSKL